MSQIDQSNLEIALQLLGSLVDEQAPLHLVVCGGSSLLALGLIRRTTTLDVDVLAKLENGELVLAKPLPDWLSEAAQQVAQEIGFTENWFNTGPSDESFFRLGLPEGIADRLTTRDYGSCLHISFIGRLDQIHLKLYAAADHSADASGKHFQDLTDLAPNAEELLAASRWTRQHDPSEGFLWALTEILKRLNHGDLVPEL